MKFYIGIAALQDAWAFPRVMITVNRLHDRWLSFRVNNWMLDSGGFSQILQYGKFDMSPKAYASEIRRWKMCGTLVGAVAQDWMCDPLVREKTGKTVEEHQELTIKNYVDLLPHVNGTRILPVLQGYKAKQYADHVRAYGNLLKPNQWVAVGSVVSRSGDPVQIRRILEAIKSERSDIHLHGFGLKTESLRDRAIRNMLFSSDSMAWSAEWRFESWKVYASNGKKEGDQWAKLQADPRMAMRYAIEMQTLCEEEPLIKWWRYDANKAVRNIGGTVLKGYE